MKTHLVNYINIEHHGARNRIPSEKEIVESWYDCLDFFKDREAYHQESAKWYFDQMRLMESKGARQIELSKIAWMNQSHYLELIGAAICNGFSFHKKSEVNHAGV